MHESQMVHRDGTLLRANRVAIGGIADMPQMSRAPRCDAIDPGCVKTHTSVKCRKHNSPARHRSSRVQYDLTLRDAIARRYFYVWRNPWSFRTTKTHRRHARSSEFRTGLLV